MYWDIIIIMSIISIIKKNNNILVLYSTQIKLK